MGRSREYRVINKRLHFKCVECGTIKNVSVPNNIRRKNIRCYKCGKVTNCKFNRKAYPRQYQRGKILLTTNQGSELEVDLRDMSFGGIGLEIPIGTPLKYKFKIGQKVQLKCSWNPSLLSHGRFIIKNISGRRIGLAKRN